MANGLEVNAGGLRAAAGASDALAAGLVAGAVDGCFGGDDPSAAGVGAVNAALNVVRERQARRVVGQAGDLSVGGGRYDDTDSSGAGAISATV
ncbi:MULTISPECIES: hypothetical protein [Mycobacterium]|uniref:ESX-1 secretion-associated protein n=1 Tax=Mycobacterium syngnathidarum TaxID=1908205 RepID=A0A1S1K3E0_9MYCO|nr:MULTISPECIES: hypothetical protein [Mycobacterium]MCG7608827.1 hypothetical protein [Mycobacterium sp. CnD-18-1]OHU01478.1 hypothetical protein BKG61_08125 [Mycobacterium syngnathidarum]OLT97465.1 hypothetical protein BKG60_05170 [Mycobacterium syngnathidarum]